MLEVGCGCPAALSSSSFSIVTVQLDLEEERTLMEITSGMEKFYFAFTHLLACSCSLNGMERDGMQIIGLNPVCV